MAATDLVPAIWDGPYPAELPDMSLIYPGEQHLVTSEDLKSDHWKAVQATPPAAPSPSGSVSGSPSTPTSSSPAASSGPSSTPSGSDS